MSNSYRFCLGLFLLLFPLLLQAQTSDLSVTLHSYALSAEPGQSLPMRLLVTNHGPNIAAQSLVRWSLPPGSDLVAASPDCNVVGSNLLCQLGDLPVSGAKTLWVVLKSSQSGLMTNDVDISSQINDPIRANNTARLIIPVLLSGPPPSPGGLTRSGVDLAVLKQNTGGLLVDTPTGILVAANQVLKEGGNLMTTNRAIPLYITDGPHEGGTVLFGYTDSARWLPANADGLDLAGGDTALPADAVFVSVEGSGRVVFYSSAPFQPPVGIATNQVQLNPNQAWELELEPLLDWVRVYYGGKVVLEGDPYQGSETADHAMLGNDFVISVTGGPSHTGYAVISTLARDARLRVRDFPLVRAPLASPSGAPLNVSTNHEGITAPEMKTHRSLDVLNRNDRADLVIFLENIGSAGLSNVAARLSLPTGSGMSITGLDVQSYGSILSGASVGRSFSIETANTPVGVYPLHLELMGDASGTLTNYICVWDISHNVLDVSSGRIDMRASTPFATSTLNLTMPEVYDAAGMPSHFDIQRVVHRMVQKQPFKGIHWGDAVLIPPQLIAAMNHPTVLLGAPRQYLTGGSVRMICEGGNKGVGGVRVTIRNKRTGETKSTTTDENGNYSFGELPEGEYILCFEPPPELRKFIDPACSDPNEPILINAEGLVQGVFVLPRWEIMCPPPETDPSPPAPPANAQGQSQTQPAGTPAPAPAGTPAGGGNKTGKSVVAGGLTGLGAVILNCIAAPTGAGTPFFVLSVLGSALAGAGQGVSDDPIDQDTFWFGQEQTPPQDINELTTEETVVQNLSFTPPLSAFAPSTISNNFTYTRVTDQRSYNYSLNERLTFDKYLPVDFQINKTNLQSGELFNLFVRPATAAGEILKGPDVLVEAWMTRADSRWVFGEMLLFDDGQGPDTRAGDGIFSASPSAPTLAGDFEIYVMVSRTGFYQREVPSAYGWARKRISVSGGNQLFKITSIAVNSSNQLTIVFNSNLVNTQSFQIVYADSLSEPWTVDGNAILTNLGPSLFNFTLSKPSSARFYRLRLNP